MIKGINHITLAAKDLGLSFRFYTEVLGFRPLALWNKGAYLLAGNSWLCLALDNKTRTGPLEEYTHTAFTVSIEHFEELSKRIIGSGAVIWHQDLSEGKSLYFLDPDAHKLEIHIGDWQSRLASCILEPYPGMKLFE
jgi:glutathione S-transferase fosA5